MLAALMMAHLGLLALGAGSCVERSKRTRETSPICKQIPGDLQRAAETYIAVVLALLAPISNS